MMFGDIEESLGHDSVFEEDLEEWRSEHRTPSQAFAAALAGA